jgi:hypothetical protein
MKEWIPTFTTTNLLKDVTYQRKLINFEQTLYWPLSNREAFIGAHCFPIESMKGAGIIMKSVGKSSYGVDLPKN